MSPSEALSLRPTDEPDGPTWACPEYVLHPDAAGIWLTVGGLSLYIRRSMRPGVLIDVLPLGGEDGESLGELCIREDQISRPEA